HWRCGPGWFRRTLGVLIALAAVGCHPMGARTIPTARFDYNQAIIESFDAQMLLNLVRLRYQDSILFLDLGSVVASYHREVSGGLTPNVSAKPFAYGTGASVGGNWSETPTISYAPLQGEDFAKRLLEPVEPSAILLLSRSGWGLERLMLCAVQQLNELLNGTAIGGVAPVKVHHFDRFRRVAQMLRELQELGQVQLNTLAGDVNTVVITAGPMPMDAAAEAKAREIIRLLNVRTDHGPISVEAPGFPRDPANIVLTGRSFLGVMTFLAQHVEVPHEHERAGLVRVTRGPDGKAFDWHAISGGLFRVKSGRSKPKRSYLAVQHRGYWFWIDDTDIEAKATYTLLTQLFSLQAASGKLHAPVLTIPAR
ncbi:MAG TPA: hypothetical protein VFZ61_26075, partial [Polyangiales bacterium]